MPPSARRQGVLALIIVVLAWGFTWPVNKVVLQSLSPLWAVTLRSAIATVSLFALAAARGPITLPPRGDLPVLLGRGEAFGVPELAGLGQGAGGSLQLGAQGVALLPVELPRRLELRAG